jgi:hypothetical protein
MKHKMLTAALPAALVGLFATATAAVAGQPAPQTLDPPPPDIYACTPNGGGTICRATQTEVKVSEPQPELVCGSGAASFVIHDNGRVDQRWTRVYDNDGKLTKREVREYWSDTFWSNPLSGKTVPYTQFDRITDILTSPGDFDSTVETQVGENQYFDPATHKLVLSSAGRIVFGPDGLVAESGPQPFIEAFEFGDMSVFDPVCAALS